MTKSNYLVSFCDHSASLHNEFIELRGLSRIVFLQHAIDGGGVFTNVKPAKEAFS